MLTLDWSYVFDRDQLISLYLWLDSIPFTRKKRQIEKDFADGGIRDEGGFLFRVNVSFVLLLSDLNALCLFSAFCLVRLFGFFPLLKKDVLGY